MIFLIKQMKLKVYVIGYERCFDCMSCYNRQDEYLPIYYIPFNNTEYAICDGCHPGRYLTKQLSILYHSLYGELLTKIEFYDFGIEHLKLNPNRKRHRRYLRQICIDNQLNREI